MDGQLLQCAGEVIVEEAGVASGILPAIFIIQPGTVNCLPLIFLSNSTLTLVALFWHLADQ